MLLLEHTYMDGRMHFAGVGNCTRGIMFVFTAPKCYEANLNKVFSDERTQVLIDALKEVGFTGEDKNKIRLTYGIKHSIFNDAKPTRELINKFSEWLKAEILYFKPKVVVPLGLDAASLIMPALSSSSLGLAIDFPDDNNIKVVPVWSPSYILRQSYRKAKWIDMLKVAFEIYKGVDQKFNAPEFEIVDQDSKLDIVKSKIKGKDIVIHGFSISGDDYMDNSSTLRLLSINIDVNCNYLLPLYPAGDYKYNQEQPNNCLSIKSVISFLDWLFNEQKISLIGHNIKHTAGYIDKLGLNIIDNISYDIMVAEHCINNLSDLSLEGLISQYTEFAHFDSELRNWKQKNIAFAKYGYAMVPDEILYPYAATISEAIRRIYLKQKHKLVPYLNDIDGKSLFSQAMDTEKDLYNLRKVGLPINIDYALQAAKHYEKLKATINIRLKTILANLYPDLADINLDSSEKLRLLLFDKMGLEPIKTSGKYGIPWEWVKQKPLSEQNKYQPHTGIESLELLVLNEQNEIKRNILELLIEYKRLHQLYKNFLRSDKTKGILAHVYPDNRLHAEFGQLTDTGRFTSCKPNVQNFSKHADSYLCEICTKYKCEHMPLRKIISTVDDSFNFIEADYEQAELFVMAYLSGDANLIECLTTPGRDLHTETAMESFNIKFMDPNDNHFISVDEMIERAKHNKGEFKLWQKKWIVINGDKQETFDEFNKTLRTAAKAVTYGIPYGRKANSIANEIRIETGNNISIQDVNQMISKWKSKFSTAWNWLNSAAAKAANEFVIENCFGRRRYFYSTSDQSKLASYRREALNYPVQSVVAELIKRALTNINRRLILSNFKTKVVNQIHDAIMTYGPSSENEQVKRILEEELTSQTLPGTDKHLQVDIKVFKMWG